MLVPGDYSDAFRSLGQLLETARALQVAVTDQGPILEVSWSDRQGTRQERHLREEDLSALNMTGILYRGIGVNTNRYGAADLLRALGQRLDELRVERVSVAETDHGFQVGGRCRGEPFSRTFSFSDLVSLTDDLRRARDRALHKR